MLCPLIPMDKLLVRRNKCTQAWVCYCIAKTNCVDKLSSAGSASYDRERRRKGELLSHVETRTPGYSQNEIARSFHAK
jgi:hypothetical protein